MVTNEGGAVSGVYGGFTQFLDTATAGQATLVSNGGLVSGAFGGFIDLLDETNAESATFISNPGEAAGAYAAYTLVQTSGNTGSSTFIANPASVPDAEGGGWRQTMARPAALALLPMARRLPIVRPDKSTPMVSAATRLTGPKAAVAAGAREG